MSRLPVYMGPRQCHMADLKVGTHGSCVSVHDMAWTQPSGGAEPLPLPHHRRPHAAFAVARLHHKQAGSDTAKTSPLTPLRATHRPSTPYTATVAGSAGPPPRSLASSRPPMRRTSSARAVCASADRCAAATGFPLNPSVIRHPGFPAPARSYAPASNSAPCGREVPLKSIAAHWAAFDDFSSRAEPVEG